LREAIIASKALWPAALPLAASAAAFAAAAFAAAAFAAAAFAAAAFAAAAFAAAAFAAARLAEDWPVEGLVTVAGRASGASGTLDAPDATRAFLASYLAS